MANAKKIRKKIKQEHPTSKRHTEPKKKFINTRNRIRGDSKRAKLIVLLKRPEGATIDEMTSTTGWQRHSIRGVISGVLKKRPGLSVTTLKGERGRIYRIAI